MIAGLVAKRPLHARRVRHHEIGEPLGGRGTLRALVRESSGAARGEAERGEGGRGAAIALATATGMRAFWFRGDRISVVVRIDAQAAGIGRLVVVLEHVEGDEDAWLAARATDRRGDARARIGAGGRSQALKVLARLVVRRERPPGRGGVLKSRREGRGDVVRESDDLHQPAGRGQRGRDTADEIVAAWK